MEIRGQFRREGEARAKPGVLTRSGQLIRVLHVETREVLGDAERGDLKLSARLGSIPRQIVFPGSWAFETDDNDGVDALLGRLGSGLLPKLERFGPHLVGFAVAAFVFAVVFYRWGLPTLTEVAVNATPVGIEEAIADGAIKSLDATVFDESAIDVERVVALEASFGEMVEAYERMEDAREGLNFQLLARRSDLIGANALALPGGTVVVTDDLLKLIENDEEVLAVLAHEIAHVHHRHGLYGLYRSVGLGAFLLFLGGDLNALVEDLVVQGALLSNLAATRSMESEADRTAVKIALESGIDPRGLARALKRLTEDAGVDPKQVSWLSSHPATQKRSEEIEEAIEAN